MDIDITISFHRYKEQLQVVAQQASRSFVIDLAAANNVVTSIGDDSKIQMQSFISAQGRTSHASGTHGISPLARLVLEAARPLCTEKALELGCATA